MTESQTNNNWWALVRFPNEGNVNKILLASEISHKVIAEGHEVEYRPKSLKDVIHVMPYRIRTDCDALDGKPHSYFCQIYKLSDNIEHLKDLIAPNAKRLNWTRITNFPKDPETSCDETHVLAGSGVLLPKQKELTTTKQLNKENQNNHLDAAIKHLSKDNSSNSNMNISPSNLEEKYVQEIQRLQEQLRSQRKELEEEKKRNMAAAVSDNAISALKTELTEFLNQRMLAMAQENKKMVNHIIVQNTELKEEISGLRSGMFPRVWEWLDNISPGGF